MMRMIIVMMIMIMLAIILLTQLLRLNKRRAELIQNSLSLF